MPLPKVIAVLEDDRDRRLEMFQWLDDRFYMYRSMFFRTAPDMIEWLGHSQDQALLLSLDHDLHPVDSGPEEWAAAGNGRDVVDFLCAEGRRTARIPVIVHSANAPAALGMSERLAESAWPCMLVGPHDDLAWIGSDWMRAMKKALRATGDAANRRVEAFA